MEPKKRRNRREKTPQSTIDPSSLLIFGGRFQCRKSLILGKGTFGEIYIGIDTIQKEYVAIKLDKSSLKGKEPQLENEKTILDFFSDSEGFPKVYDYGPYLDSFYLAMELLGPSLNDLYNYCKKKFSLQTILLISIQMIERIEEFHKKNFIHRDIKPENFTIGIGSKSNIIYLIDFGLSKKFKDKKTMEHILYRELQEMIGTPRYASINNHLGIELSRRDDLESICYVLIYFMKKKLPWQNVLGKNQKEKYKKILEKKLTVPIEVLCRDIPKEFLTMLDYSRSLRYDERPDYDFLKGILKELLFSIYYEDFVFDWTENPKGFDGNKIEKNNSFNLNNDNLNDDGEIKRKKTGAFKKSNDSNFLIESQLSENLSEEDENSDYHSSNKDSGNNSNDKNFSNKKSSHFNSNKNSNVKNSTILSESKLFLNNNAEDNLIDFLHIVNAPYDPKLNNIKMTNVTKK